MISFCYRTVANSSYVSNGNVSKEPAFGNRVVRAHCHGDYCGLFFGWDAEVAHAASQKLGSPVRAGKDAPPPVSRWPGPTVCDSVMHIYVVSDDIYSCFMVCWHCTTFLLYC